MNLLRVLLPACAMSAILFVGASSAKAAATTFDVSGLSSDVSAEITFEYVASGANAGTVTVTITNTSSLAAGSDPRVTGFAFNTPGNITSLTSFTTIPSGWTGTFDPDAISPPQQTGDFDAAGLTGANINGGFPNEGIARGDTVTFIFDFAGTDMDTLNEASFLDLISAGGEANSSSFAVRFQRVDQDGVTSDVAVPGDPGDPGDPGTPVPEPTTAALLGLGAILFAWRKRRARA